MDALKASNSKYPNCIQSYSFYRKEVIEAIEEYDKLCGVKFARFPLLNTLLKGMRQSEITVVSGQTGIGKSTFLSEYSLDLCLQGVRTLWINLEMSNSMLLKMMITQFGKQSFVGKKEEFEKFEKEFEKLPMYFLHLTDKNHTVEKILDMIKTSVEENDIHHVVVDNIQCLLNFDITSLVGFDYLKHQDFIFTVLKNISENSKCHVTLVVHPRKEVGQKELTNASISGTGKIIQQSNNIILLQRVKDVQYLEVSKNRFAGVTGSLIMEFDETSLTNTLKKCY